MSLVVTVNSVPLLAVLARLYAATDDLTPIMDTIGYTLETRVRERFETMTDPLGLPWADWQPSTKESYPKDGHGTLLDRAGQLLGGTSYQATANSAIIGFDREYAEFHEYGTEKMARRGLLFADQDARTLAPDDEQTLLAVVAAALDAALD